MSTSLAALLRVFLQIIIFRFFFGLEVSDGFNGIVTAKELPDNIKEFSNLATPVAHNSQVELAQLIVLSGGYQTHLLCALGTRAEAKNTDSKVK